MRYKLEMPLPTGKATKDPRTIPGNADLASYERQYPKSLFNKGVRTQDEEHIGHVMKKTDNMIVIWAHYDWRIDYSNSKIIAVGRNVILGMNYQNALHYRVGRNAPLPTGEQ